MKYIIYTLGCKVNQYETQAIETMLNEHGHFAAAEGERADAIIVNTCAVTAEAGRKSRQAIHRLMEENPGAVLAVSGCYSQIAPDWAKKQGAKVIFGANDRTKLVAAIENAVECGEEERNIDKPFERRKIEALPAGAAMGRTRAMLKIQDGCVNFCTYCIIPYTRGRVRSQPIEDAARQARELAEAGYKELVITGIEIASYGVDLPGKPDLADVICAISEAAPETRLRLGSIEPSIITREFCEKLSACGNVCRHFHLSLQSGSDTTLKNMNRKYDSARFYEGVQLLNEYFPNCGLTADMIVGFPGETEEHHKEALAFIEKCGFSDMHIFPYSRRPGTPADKMDGQCDRKTKAERSKDARAVASGMTERFLKAQVGQILPVLFETEENGVYQGHSDNYVLVRAEGENLRGLVKDVEITGVSGGMLVGKTV